MMEPILDKIFWTAALGGSFLFVMRGLFLFLGVAHEEAASDGEFKIFSLHALAGFLMLFGWVGLMGLYFDWNWLFSLFVSFLAGSVMFYSVGVLVKGMQRLSSRGDHFLPEKAMGKTGMIYLKITKERPGRLHVVVEDVIRELSARSVSGEEIPSFSEVKVVAVEQDYVIVERV